ncbi:MAG: serine/threonine protein kinase [Planctomycetota bacterium]|jgi:serine/threonine protein kinase
MAVTLEEFVEYLAEIGFTSAEEVYGFLDDLPVQEHPTSARRLVKVMLAHKKLTKFQAEMIFKGRTKRLVLGNYVIEERIGRGGMGRVYKARHRRMDRLVALKVLPWKARESPEDIKRFHREMKAAARLAHPNIVTAFDADEARGIHFLVTEYVEGCDLLELVRQNGPLALGSALDYVVQAAEGLEYAHSVQVIHLDIKPANLLLDEHGVVKILDMGLARITDVIGGPVPEEGEALIQSGKVMGTVDYVSPERAHDPKAVDHRADIYSLGCTLYYLLTGRPPYRGSTLKRRILAHRLKPVPSLKAKCPEVPHRLDAVFRRMVAKAPEDRHRSMREVIDDLSASTDTPDRRPIEAGAADLEPSQLAPADDDADDAEDAAQPE